MLAGILRQWQVPAFSGLTPFYTLAFSNGEIENSIVLVNNTDDFRSTVKERLQYDLHIIIGTL